MMSRELAQVKTTKQQYYIISYKELLPGQKVLLYRDRDSYIYSSRGDLLGRDREVYGTGFVIEDSSMLFVDAGKLGFIPIIGPWYSKYKMSQPHRDSRHDTTSFQRVNVLKRERRTRSLIKERIRFSPGKATAIKADVIND